MKKQIINENMSDLYIELGYLRNDYNLALSTIQGQREDIKRFRPYPINCGVVIPIT